MAVSNETAIIQITEYFITLYQSKQNLLRYHGYHAAKFAATKSQFTKPQNASTYFGRALRKSM